jgi:uncharacterized protein (DUF58 family)
MRTATARYLGDLFLPDRLFLALAATAILFTASQFLPWLTVLPKLLAGSLAFAAAMDYAFLFLPRSGIDGVRSTPERLSNGDDNTITASLTSHYRFPLHVELIDELPPQFQVRDFSISFQLGAGGARSVSYTLRPNRRGDYGFGSLLAYVRSPIGLVERRYRFEASREVPVFPSFLQMRRFQLLAISNRLTEIGVKRVRRVGHSMEFEQVRDYVAGDDVRTINWKATARRSHMMVNSYTEEKSQQVYCLIDKGRSMKMPFDGLSLLDHAINASVVLSHVALLRQDKAGILTFSEEMGRFLPASRRAAQMSAILEALHAQRTRYMESDYERLYAFVRRRITQRSLLMLFTNFESVEALRRQLPHLRRMAAAHLLIVVFFENDLLTERASGRADSVEDVYRQTIAARFVAEKRLIVHELQRYGIRSLLTPPSGLGVAVVNRYLELKSRQAI